MNNTLELQSQVRHNAEEMRNTLNDLYNWEKEMKEQEKKIIQQNKTQKDVTNVSNKSCTE